jgi:hypothetical protein
MNTAMSTRGAGKQVFEREINTAGLRCAEQSVRKLGHYRLFNDGGDGSSESIRLKLTTSSNQTFSLYKADRSLQLLVYIWNVGSADDCCIYALTYDEAFRTMHEKGYTQTLAWNL